MKHAEAEKLLGGYATGTLTEAERKVLFAAALDHQGIFEALMNEEALRELLADPAAKAQLLAALAVAPPKVVPFYRRPGLLGLMGAAASLIVAATAGLAYLRSPDALPPVARQEAAKVPVAEAAALPAAAQAPAVPARKAPPAPPPKEAAAPLRIMETPAPAHPFLAPPAPAVSARAPFMADATDAARERNQMEYRRMEARDSMAKQAEAPRPAPAAMEVIGAIAPPPGEPKAKATGGVGMSAGAATFAPAWTLDLQPDGSTRVMVTAPRGPQVLLLRRGAAGVEVLKLQPMEDRRSALVSWRGQVRLTVGDVLDLYLLDAPVADPARLPETDPVCGFRARIHPSVK